MSDTTAVNQAYFNKLAAEYDERFKNTVGRLQEEVKSRADLLGATKDARLLDYACGTGLLSRSLGPQIAQCVGIDISESMVGQYNAKARSEGLSEDQRNAYLGNLLKEDDPSPKAFEGANFHDFDIAGVGLGFHHVDDCHLAAKRLVARLKPGGVFFIVDFAAHDAMPGHTAAHGVRHHGFSEDETRAIFEGAGAGKNFKFDQMADDVVFENAHGEGKNMVRKVFFARGEKSA